MLPGVRRTAVFSALVVMVVTSTLLGNEAKALTQTPWTCDGIPKYFCATVEYDNFGSYVNVQSRWWKGAIDGGANRWQIWWVQDWTKVGGTYNWVRGWGQGSWLNNVQLSTAPWYRIQGFSINQPALINFRLRYYACDAMGFNCWYWCSPQLDHYLDTNTSAPLAGAPCTGG